MRCQFVSFAFLVLRLSMVVGAVTTTTRRTTSILADFTGASTDGPPPQMITVNDPVMGGESYSTVEEATDGTSLVWEGEVKMVKFLHSPGFCNLRTAPTDFSAAVSTRKLSDTETVSFVVHADTDFMTPLSVNAAVHTESGDHRDPAYTYSATLQARPHHAGHTTVELYAAWKDFVATRHGTPVDAPPLVGEQLDKINVLGLSTYKSNTAAKFRVELLQITVSSSSEEDQQQEEQTNEKEGKQNIRGSKSYQQTSSQTHVE